MVSLEKLPESAFNWLERLRSLWSSKVIDFPWSPAYQPEHLTHVVQVFEDGTLTLKLVVYLPEGYRTPQTQVQVTVGRSPWQDLSQELTEPSYWTLELDGLYPGKSLQFRHRFQEADPWKPIVPLNDLECVSGLLYIPHLTYTWENPVPTFHHASILLETTLEGLLAGYKGGRFAPRSREEMFQQSIAQRVMKTNIPERLKEWSIDEVMVPVLPSVSDRSHLDPKFNYLTYNVADVDWQIGTCYELKKLIDRFCGNQLKLVPDMIFAHQVRSPYEGSLDQIVDQEGKQHAYVDKEAFLFRDYGTWMINFSNPDIRRQVVEKISSFVVRYRLDLIRVDYVDGIIMQYSKREPNYGEILLRELKQELLNAFPALTIVGEAFEAANNPAAQEFIDDYYAPVGFCLAEELYKPPSEMERPLYPDIERILPDLTYGMTVDRRMAIYAQLHDETWTDEHILAGRPHVPWAYGGHPAELARRRGEELIESGLVQESELLDCIRRTVRGVESLTLFSSKLRYMFVPAVDSLSLGSLDSPQQWKAIWEGVTTEQLTYWTQRGMAEEEIIRLHALHRRQMVALRQIYREHTLIDPNDRSPLTQVDVFYRDLDQSILGLRRVCLASQDHTLIIVFNLGPKWFSYERCYELPLPEGCHGEWEVLFDGDWDLIDGDTQPMNTAAYPPGSRLQTLPGIYSNQENVLRLNLGSNSLLVLRFMC